ncbi:MAG: efflux RND transporter periplasmic adaptor subunit [Rikenellaceae bacterium]
MKKKTVIITLLVVALASVGVYYFYPKSDSLGNIRWVSCDVTSENIVESITATGTIEPVTSVDVGTQVSGILTTLYVDYNSVVKKGQVIAELDKSTLLLDLNSNKNNVDAAKSKYDFELANYTRNKLLFEKGLIADSEYETALYSYETSKTSYETAKNDLARSETNLGYATIYSPIDGVVLSRSVEEGQTVASSYSTPTLFTVAADLKDMQVIVDVDEADIGNVAEGDKAQFTVDAYPFDVFDGVVTQVRLEATVESNVVTYEVVISAENADLKLKPGLTANVEVFVLDTPCDIVVPAAALSFTPPTTSGSEPKGRPEGAPSGMGGGAPSGEAPMGEAPMGTSSKSVVWVEKGDQIEPREVKTGASNGISTQIISGISKSDKVVIGYEEITEAVSAEESSTENPFLMKRPGQK